MSDNLVEVIAAAACDGSCRLPGNFKPCACFAQAERAASTLVNTGWAIYPPGSVPMPRNLQEAQYMNILSENYIKTRETASDR